jgi:hypothetical protein
VAPAAPAANAPSTDNRVPNEHAYPVVDDPFARPSDTLANASDGGVHAEPVAPAAPAAHSADATIAASGTSTIGNGVIAGPNGGAAMFDFSKLEAYSDAAVQAEIDARAGETPIKNIAPPQAAPANDGRPDTASDYRQSLAASGMRSGGSQPAEGELDEELIPGFRSFIGNIFTRPKSARPEPEEEEREIPPESASIADRIARDFGLLGDDPPAGH